MLDGFAATLVKRPTKGTMMRIRLMTACVMAAALVLSIACCSPIKPPAATIAPKVAPETGATSSVVPFDATAPPTDGHGGPVDRGFEVQTSAQHGRFDSRPARGAMNPRAKERDDVDDHDEPRRRDQGAAAIVERSDLFRSPRPGP